MTTNPVPRAQVLRNHDDTAPGKSPTDLPDIHEQVDLVAMILSAIADVAPELEAERADLDHDVDFWRELQLDSMDHLAVVTRLSEQTGIEIAERDSPHLTTISSLRDFIAKRPGPAMSETTNMRSVRSSPGQATRSATATTTPIERGGAP